MLTTRVIPCLLLQDGGLVKTVKFKNPSYVGDPINAVRIFNDKEVDELVFLDITASLLGQKPSFHTIADIAGECFMPLTYGGGIASIDDIKTILAIGVEKVSINSHALVDPLFIRAAADKFGSQSIVVSVDVKKNMFGKYEVFTRGGIRKARRGPVEVVVQMQELGAGEILLNSIDRDGTMVGYDLDLVGRVSRAVDIPVVASGGAGELRHFAEAIKEGASAVSAGSMFVFHGRHRAVLISYPSTRELHRTLSLRAECIE